MGLNMSTFLNYNEAWSGMGRLHLYWNSLYGNTWENHIFYHTEPYKANYNDSRIGSGQWFQV